MEKKLSELMREGAKLNPQLRDGRYVSGYPLDKNPEVRTCALGAAYLAAGNNYGIAPAVYDWLFAHFPMDTPTPLPDGIEVTEFDRYYRDDSLFNAINYLNDDLAWTRERIADWLEGKGY
jgi:hypothetical protein